MKAYIYRLLTSIAKDYKAKCWYHQSRGKYFQNQTWIDRMILYTSNNIKFGKGNKPSDARFDFYFAEFIQKENSYHVL